MQLLLDRFKRYGQLDAIVVVFVSFVRDEVFEAVGDSSSTVIRMSAQSFTEGRCNMSVGFADGERCSLRENLHWIFVQDRNGIPLVLRSANHLEEVQAICGSRLVGLFDVEIVIRVGLHPWLAGCMESYIESRVRWLVCMCILLKPKG